MQLIIKHPSILQFEVSSEFIHFYYRKVIKILLYEKLLCLYINFFHL